MTKTKIGLVAPLFVLLCALVLIGCPQDGGSPIPPEGTRVESSDTEMAVFRTAARDLQGHCEAIGGCTCFLDGFQTTCSLVFACLDAGFCERVQ